MKSQLGFVVFIFDGQKRANIVHYGSSSCHRVSRSVMAAEEHALVYAFDHAYMVREMLLEVLGREVSLEAFVDSRTLFNVIAKDSNTADRRLQIDVFALRGSYRRREMKRISWISGKENAADALTKEGISQNWAMWKVMTTNILDIDETRSAWKTQRDDNTRAE